MARGWESKSVEERQEAAAQQRVADAAPEVPEAEAERRREFVSLQLVRARVLADLQRACRPAHRGMLETALADVEARIAAAREAVSNP
ncbi:hypothetical protein LuPra_04282 [Luteitalea pratensis]|uniref:Uncharacterized protein n=1 Tax=Luteitalea pratensis TaxID=1855912 RepID=A0A143PSA3_LUTPR|nr:hypothetical protein [Luteitalea pratensis]AMY11038.1 hypothetical protein LuPra_04282 [Luteitalea pratensis]